MIMSNVYASPETMLDARTMRQWVVDSSGEEAIAKHIVAVSTNIKGAIRFGIDAVKTCSDSLTGLVVDARSVQRSMCYRFPYTTDLKWFRNFWPVREISTNIIRRRRTKQTCRY